MNFNQYDRQSDDEEINAVKLDIIIDSEAFRNRSHPKHQTAIDEFLKCHGIEPKPRETSQEIKSCKL